MITKIFVIFLMMLSAVSQAKESVRIKIENLSNSKIVLQVAYTKSKSTISSGHFIISPNTSRMLKFRNDGLHVRVVQGGKELRFGKPGAPFSVRSFPLTNDVFRVVYPSAKKDVWRLQWGPRDFDDPRDDSYGNNLNIRAGGKLPEGWTYKEFFMVSSDKSWRILPR